MVSFFIYDLIFLIAFSLFVGIFLWRNRKNLKRDGLMYLYRTKIGMKIIDKVGGKYPRTLKFLSYLSIISGYFLMVLMMYFLIDMVWVYIENPLLVKAIKVPPLMPLIPYLPSMFKVTFLPPFYFTYWILAIACIAIFHEFAHGILMKRYGVPIKSTGFGFLGPFLAAFVEQDDEQMTKKGKFEQIAILSAGTFTNLVLAIFFFILLGLFFMVAYSPAGATFNTYITGPVNVSEMQSIGGINITNANSQNILTLINETNLTDEIQFGHGNSSLNFTEVRAEDKIYYLPIENIKTQLEQNDGKIILYEDYPAIRSGMRGIIVSIDNNSIKSYNDLNEIMKKYSPGDEIKITTKYNGELNDYDIQLASDEKNESRAIIGIGIVDGSSSILRKIINSFMFFRESATDYEPNGNSNFIVFIYNLIWWLAVVNISVALVNMLPMGIFDGGRMFMLTIAGITRNEKIGEISFQIATWIILGMFFLLMASWFFAIF